MMSCYFYSNCFSHSNETVLALIIKTILIGYKLCLHLDVQEVFNFRIIIRCVSISLCKHSFDITSSRYKHSNLQFSRLSELLLNSSKFTSVFVNLGKSNRCVLFPKSLAHEYIFYELQSGLYRMFLPQTYISCSTFCLKNEIFIQRWSVRQF